MKKVIIDTDCTIDVTDCDMDDAFAVFYLLSCDDVDVRMITTTFGNNDEDVTYNATAKMLSDLDIDVPLYKGGIYPHEAAYAIKEEVENNDDIIILSLGATTNTQKAISLGMDPNKLAGFVAMGGITEKLQFNKKVMRELNLSIDYLSTRYILERVKKADIITGNNCMAHRYRVDRNPEYNSRFMNYLKPSLLRMTDEFLDEFGERELVVWDALAALYITNPEFFTDHEKNIKVDENLFYGYLVDGDDKTVNLPQINEDMNAMAFIVDVIEKAGR